MAIVNRSFTYKTRIRVSAPDFNLALAGSKSCTIRLGTICVGNDTLRLTDGTRSTQILVTSVENNLNYEDLTNDHALREGFNTLEELQSDLRRYYRNIDPHQPMSIINFELL